MFKRVCIIVLDSVGIGAMPDAVEYGDAGAHTLGNVYKACGGLNLPHLFAMGLGNIEDSRLPAAENPTASYGRMAELTKAKDTTSGHWEMMGLILDPPFKTVEKFPESMLRQWNPAGWLGNYPASGTAILDQLGAEHMQTGLPIVYTSADSVFQVAAHEDVIPLPDLYKLCEKAREMLVGDLFIGRVIARPFTGKPGAFTRTENRKDYAVPPTSDTLLDALEKQGQFTLGIGKVEDIFCNCGVKYVDHTKNNESGIKATINALKSDGNAALIFTNLVDFDMKYGHRNDPKGYGQALEAFDAELPKILDALNDDDLLIITADHGCDPTTSSTDHSREYVPLLVYSEKSNNPANLGTRATFADVAATIYDLFGHGEWCVGESFAEKL